jgi:dienelactone hydrolase
MCLGDGKKWRRKFLFCFSCLKYCVPTHIHSQKLDGVVSFHGVLQSDPIIEPIHLAKGINRRPLRSEERASDENFNSKVSILIENGTLDEGAGPKEQKLFWEEMTRHDAKNVQFHDHIDAEHGFALAPGVISTKYHELADRRSTISMLLFFVELWGPKYSPNVTPRTVNACGTNIGSYWPTFSKL